MKSITKYSIAPILKAAILQKIRNEQLVKAPNDDPFDWYKRTFCLKPSFRQEHHSPKYQHILITQAS